MKLKKNTILAFALKVPKHHLLKLFSLVLFLMSCNSQEGDFEKQYFDLAGTLNLQLEHLKNKSAEKTWEFNGRTETKVVNDLNWKKELELFYNADINKKAFLKSYTTSVNNDTTFHTLRNGEKLWVKTMQIIKNEKNEPIEIAIECEENNYINETQQSLNIILKDNKIETYKIINHQKLLFGKLKKTTISSKIKN
jgi:hypothetical protein